ncbi:MAG: allophanate hydrolase subunit 1 [Terrimesophilobacter sp.]
MKVLPFGDRALLAEFDSLHETMAAFRSLDAQRRPGLVELVPAARTVLVEVDPELLSLRAAEQWLRAASDSQRLAVADTIAAKPVVIPVCYNGPDILDAAAILGISANELISRHSLAEWRCAFIGFAPGFAYLASEYADFSMSRRKTSRPSVPAGSVGLAGEFTGIYPRSSPGGWQLIGTTDATLWDETRWDESSVTPAMISPGTIVRFEVVEP